MQNVKKNIINGIITILDKTIRLEANSTSCLVSYEPKAPIEIKSFRRTK